MMTSSHPAPARDALGGQLPAPERFGLRMLFIFLEIHTHPPETLYNAAGALGNPS
jgi:hypothetical protein